MNYYIDEIGIIEEKRNNTDIRKRLTVYNDKLEQISIKEARKSADLSQAAMSDLFEIPKRTIEQWETGKRKCPDYTRKLIVEKLLQIKKMEG